jgi:hydroxyethylthiazole kinase-like uncharacterized protein yjeF
MIPILTPQQMRSADDYAIHHVGISSLQLMENAGKSVVKVLKKYFNNFDKKSFLVFCGKGNNGGDGFVVARLLHTLGASVKVVLIEDKSQLSGDAMMNFKKLDHSLIQSFSDFKNKKGLSSDVIIDAMFGTSFKGELRGEYLDAVQWCHQQKAFKVAVDIPSGLNGETGEILSDAFRADVTVTFSHPKLGFYRHNAKEYTGTVHIADIGIPEEAIEKHSGNIFLVERHDIRALLPKRKSNAHKHSVGKIFILAGSKGMTGAALLSSQSAMRSGAGQVILGIPDSEYAMVAKRTLEVMPYPLPSTEEGTIALSAMAAIEKKTAWADIIAIGCGMSQNTETQEFILQFIHEAKKPLLIDADGLNALSKDISVLQRRKSHFVILTPHYGEFARLTKISAEEIESKKFEMALAFAKEYNVILVLKGAPTIISTPTGEIFVNSTGNAGMATAGAGDVLTGIIASFAGQGLSAESAAVAGVYIHGMAGDAAAEKKGMMSMIASDMLRSLPFTLKQFQ